MHCLWEIIDNSVDEALAGALHPHRRDAAPRRVGRGRTTTAAASRSTRSPRPGCPASRWSSPSCTPAASSAAARTTPPVACTASGSSVVNALSARLDVEVDRSPATQHDVVPARRPRRLRRATGPTAAFTPQSGLHKGKRVAKGVTGTRVRFWPDRQIFTKDATFVFDELVTRARQTSFIVPGLELVLRDLRGAEPVEESVQARRRDHRVLRVPRHDEPVTERAPARRGTTTSPRRCRCSTTRGT